MHGPESSNSTLPTSLSPASQMAFSECRIYLHLSIPGLCQTSLFFNLPPSPFILLHFCQCCLYMRHDSARMTTDLLYIVFKLVDIIHMGKQVVDSLQGLSCKHPNIFTAVIGSL